jgi:hypothetical protein
MATINLVNQRRIYKMYYEKCALDLVLFGGYALKHLWKRDRSQGIAEIHHIDFSRVRCGKIDENSEDDEVTTVLL